MSEPTVAEAERQAVVLDIIARDDILFAVSCLRKAEALFQFMESQQHSDYTEALLGAYPKAIAALERAVSVMEWKKGEDA